MFAPPTDTFHLDVEAISGICGSISIACWVVVFSPQIIQNFQGGSADALSIQFVIAWLLGDVFNIIGALLQGVLPTMTILAFYYAIADVVLLLQLFYYRGFTWRDEPPAPKPKKTSTAANTAANTTANTTTNIIKNGRHADERTALLAAHAEHHHQHRHRRGSDWSGFSPAVPHMSEPHVPQAPPTTLQTILWNLLVIVMVCVAGAAGWFLGQSAAPSENAPPSSGDGDGDALEFNTLGQVFGYLCAFLYIASRLPQLILNWRRKTTEGLSMLFFLFACLGNATYVLSIMAYEPRCGGGRPCEGAEAARLYGRYMLVNLSWLLGSAVTLLLDFGVFAQYFMYRTEEDDCALDEEEEEYQRDVAGGSESWARPLLEAGDSEHD